MQDFMESVLDAAGAIPNDANSALLILDDLVTILNVDVNVTGMNADVAVSLLALVFEMHLKAAGSVQPLHAHIARLEELLSL